MTNMKTLALAAVAALTLGVGAAQAQSMAPSSTEGAYYARPATAIVSQVPAGSSDRALSFFGGAHTAPQPQGVLQGGDGGAG